MFRRHHGTDPRPPAAAELASFGRPARGAAVGLTVTAIIAAVALVGPGSSLASEAAASSNGGLEHGLRGWATSGDATLTNVAHSGTKAVALTAGSDLKVALRDRPNLVRRTSAPAYRASAWVKARTGTVVRLRLREITGLPGSRKVLATNRAQLRIKSGGWHELSLTVAPAAGHELGVAVVGRLGKAGDRLLLDDVGITPTAGPTPGAATAPPVAETTTTGAKSTANVKAGDGTLFGTSMYTHGSEVFTAAMSRRDKDLGKPTVYRVFYPGVPPAWPGNAGKVDRPVVVSFKIMPSQVLSGKYDSQLTKWFTTAPKDRAIYWSYFHEPENDIQRKQFSAATYREAWKHVAALAKGAPSNMKATLILMAYTVNKVSHRNWKDYYPGSSVIDVLAWDAYNTSADKKFAASKRIYKDPAQIYGPPAAVSKAAGKPFGFAEWGSLLVPGDNGTKRAAWIKVSCAYQEQIGAKFSTYFDAIHGSNDFRLTDRASQQALAAAIKG